MRTLRSASPNHISLIQKADRTLRSFSASGRVLFMFFAALLTLSSLGLVYLLNNQFLVHTPAYGGSVSEGIIGTPRFINPVLAISDADRDLTALLYSGLLRATTQGDYIPDLAESYTVSDDGRVYTFTLRKDATFHDGEPVTAEDIVFTVHKIQDPQIKSPERVNWDGVAVEQISPTVVQFTLRQAYAPFIGNVTLGILPKHLWQSVQNDEMPFSNLNNSPIGSGPFMMDTISRNSAGIPSTYTLKAFPNYTLGQPYLHSMLFTFYQNEDDLVVALKNKKIEAASSVSPTALAQAKDLRVDRSSLNRVFGVFFNQNQSEVLRDHTVRQALSEAIDREILVREVLGGYGIAITDPVPPTIIGSSASASAPSGGSVEKARDILLAAGWETGPDGIFEKSSDKNTKTVLSFSLATGNVPELRAAAEYLRKTWAEAGIQVDVHVYDQGDLSQNVIRPRKYDALLFGEVVGRELDLFAFWDSSQRNDPGLNIALYANATADKILSDLRRSTNPQARKELYESFNQELQKDIPAIFLYTPDFMYIVPKDIRGLDLQFIETPSDRFLNAYQWHKEVDRVWPIFAKNY